MSLRNAPLGCLLLMTFWYGFALLSRAATGNEPDGRDRDVMEAVLLKLLADKDAFLMRGEGKTSIVLANRTLDSAGFIQPGQIHSYVDEAPLPQEATEDLLRRNGVAGSMEGRVVSLRDLRFEARIELAEGGDHLGIVKFKEEHPKSRGWVFLHLPGYTKDGNVALVRGFCGPSSHSVLMTALLKKQGGKWVVLWHRVVWFA